MNFVKFTSSERLCSTLNIFIFRSGFYTISIWNSTASSYGFRYIFDYSFIHIFTSKTWRKQNNNFFKHYINLFSIFGILAVLFFETTEGTQLSLLPVINSFGVEKVYSQPEYLTGVIASFFEVNSYLKILATSFLGALFLKILLLFLDLNTWNLLFWTLI